MACKLTFGRLTTSRYMWENRDVGSCLIAGVYGGSRDLYMSIKLRPYSLGRRMPFSYGPLTPLKVTGQMLRIQVATCPKLVLTLQSPSKALAASGRG